MAESTMQVGVASGSKLDPAGESWASYLAWRRTKCRPFDRDELTAILKMGDPTDAHIANDRMIEEIDQATHEFVGELAEIGELFLDRGPHTFFGADRDRLIDECGDAIFCGCWALDAWGLNPLLECDPEFGVELVRFDEESGEMSIRKAFAENPLDAIRSEGFLDAANTVAYGTLVVIQTLAGLTANAFKKVKFQRRDQDHKIQCERVVNSMEYVNALLIMANSSMAEAMAANRKKLNSRFPDNYKPGVGGGIRTGDGK